MPTERQAKLRRLAGATAPCEGAYGHGTKGAPLEPDPHPINCAHGCKGTSRVYLFGDEVRVPCPPEKPNKLGLLSMAGIHWQTQHETRRCGCNGTGWVASEDGWVWGPAIYKLRGAIETTEAFWADLAWSFLEGQDAFLKQALEAVQTIEGATLGVV